MCQQSLISSPSGHSNRIRCKERRCAGAELCNHHVDIFFVGEITIQLYIYIYINNILLVVCMFAIVNMVRILMKPPV